MRMRSLAMAVLFTAAGVVAGGRSFAQAPTAQQIDAIFAAYDRPGSPGCQLGVVQDGRILHQRGYGYANLDYAIPNSADMVYYVGSVSKQFTAAAIALLAEEGRISLDDDVRRYIPELRDYGRTMTIRHLVHHTSGLRDIYTLMSLAGIRLEDVFTNEQALALITAQRALNFLPGDDNLYSNSGYWLLGQIIERVTGQTLAQYARAKIFEPLGMNNTFFHDQPGRIIRNLVLSYGSAGGEFRTTYLANFDKIGAGGLYTTVGDLAKWDANFYEPKIGGADFLRTMHTRGVLANGDTLVYAFGNNVQQRRGLDMVRHSGSLMGFQADLVRYPTERFSVITLCNLGSISAGTLADRVTELFLGGRLRPVAATPQAPSQAAAATQSEAGRTLSAVELRAFAGRYHSPELDASYTIDVVADTLVLHRRLAGRQPLRHAGADRFTVGSQIFEFQRDAAGAVVAFTVQAGRVRNIRFDRVP